MPAGRLINVVYYLVVEGMDTKARQRFDYQLLPLPTRRPPSLSGRPGTDKTPPPGWDTDTVWQEAQAVMQFTERYN